MTALHELATDYRLPLLASRLATVQLPPPHPTAQPLVDDLWIQIAQEGLSPANLSTLMTRYSDHPFERGLMAWDALTSSLLLDDGLLRSLRAAARPVAPLLGDRRRGHAVAAPFERVMRAAATRWQGATRILLDDAIAAFDFGAMWLERGRLTVEHRAGLLDHAERLDRAHLPTTAQVGARLASLLGERRGITVWVSSMLDLDDERALATARHLDGAVPRGWVEARRALSTCRTVGLDTSTRSALVLGPRQREKRPHLVPVPVRGDTSDGGVVALGFTGPCRGNRVGPSLSPRIRRSGAPVAASAPVPAPVTDRARASDGASAHLTPGTLSSELSTNFARRRAAAGNGSAPPSHAEDPRGSCSLKSAGAHAHLTFDEAPRLHR